MSFLSSLRGLGRTLAADFALGRIGAGPGWFSLLHYRGRIAHRRRQAPPVSRVRLRLGARRLDLRLTSAHLGAFLGIFLDREYDCGKIAHAPPRTVLDLGANIGMGSLFLATLFPNAEFLCVEPDPRNLAFLRDNLALNGVHATICEGAVAAAAGTMNLRVNDDPTCSALESSPMHATQGTVRVNVSTIPALLKDAGWQKIDLLKIDIEGSEDELLSRDNGWLRDVGSILMEIHPNTTPERIDSYLQPFGFVLERSSYGREPVYLAYRPASGMG